MPVKSLILFGTRPEAIKLCPLVLYLRARPAEFDVKVCVTGQHRGMLDSVIDRFEVRPEYDLNVMEPSQTLPALTARILHGLEPVLLQEKPDFLIVQGDTTTTFAGSLAGFYQHINVAHVEAGLRTGDINRPFPEEMNRLLTTRLSTLHFAPTARARQNLLNEGVREQRVVVTGNTGIDALLYTRDRLDRGEWPGYDGELPPAGKKLILVTAHRRENFGEGMENICSAIRRIAERGVAQIIIPVHRNPNVKGVIEQRLGSVPGVHLVEPLNYVAFVDLMRRSDLLLTDSGGVQEEAPSLGKLVLVMRDKTERQEAVEAGTARLVGTDEERIVQEVESALGAADHQRGSTRIENPFGDGKACERIALALLTAEHKAGPAGAPLDHSEHSQITFDGTQRCL
jgi:UDP-N-acetylglucosamine 2-epimerase (non-hydrolysing)